MGKVVAEVSISLDGYVAGPSPTLEEPLGKGGELLHEWVVRLKAFREAHGMEGGDVDADDEVFAESVHAQGAVVMGRKMFSGGEGPWEDDPNASGWWGDDPPFHKPVFVVTHHEREPLVLGETTFTFVTDGVTSAVEQAGAVAPADRNVLVAGGADTIDQALAAGLVDELQLHVAPVLLGGGTRLFEGLGAERPQLELTAVRKSPHVSHLRYRVF
ncbi:MAG TPA: dihydrofolate reductase family protein [Gaiellaceae bacterium]